MLLKGSQSRTLAMIVKITQIITKKPDENRVYFFDLGIDLFLEVRSSAGGGGGGGGEVRIWGWYLTNGFA